MEKELFLCIARSSWMEEAPGESGINIADEVQSNERQSINTLIKIFQAGYIKTKQKNN